MDTVTAIGADSGFHSALQSQSQPESRLESHSPSQSQSQLQSQQLESHLISTRHGQLHAILKPARTPNTYATPTPPSVSSPKSTSTPIPMLLLLHGNSSSHKIFHHLLTSTHPTLTSLPRLVIDFPGHGQSSNAPDPRTGYTQRGYAEAVLDVLRELRVREFVVLGWSLGGHVGIEMLGMLEVEGEVDEAGERELEASCRTRCRGIMLVGTPPANGTMEVADGFDPSDNHAASASSSVSSRKPPLDATATATVTATAPDSEEPHMNLAGTAEWPDSAYSTFPAQGAGAPYEPWMEDAARRTDPIARSIMWESFAAGKGVDQRAVVARTNVLIAVINGASEPFVNLGLLDRLEWGNLWEGRCHRLWVEGGDGEMRGLGHTPFWEGYEVFEGVLTRFLRDCLGD